MATYTQVETNGLFELSEEARAELSSSSYYNEDLKPTTVAERKWTTYNITMLWVGMSICIPSLSLASGLIGMGVSPWLSVLNVALGNIAILIPIQLNSNVGTKYGIPFPLFARLTFGSIGAQIPALLFCTGLGRRRRCRRYHRCIHQQVRRSELDDEPSFMGRHGSCNGWTVHRLHHLHVLHLVGSLPRHG